MTRITRASLGPILVVFTAFGLGLYFTFAAVQGDYGVFRRAEINAEAAQLRARLAAVQADVARMENLTSRLSDGFLDVDLLDEQARSILGMIRVDEVVIR